MNKVGAVTKYGKELRSIGNEAGESCNVSRIARGKWVVVSFDDCNVRINTSNHPNEREAIIFAQEWLKLDAQVSARGAKAIEATYARIDNN